MTRALGEIWSGNLEYGRLPKCNEDFLVQRPIIHKIFMNIQSVFPAKTNQIVEK